MAVVQEFLASADGSASEHMLKVLGSLEMDAPTLDEAERLWESVGDVMMVVDLFFALPDFHCEKEGGLMKIRTALAEVQALDAQVIGEVFSNTFQVMVASLPKCPLVAEAFQKSGVRTAELSKQHFSTFGLLKILWSSNFDIANTMVCDEVQKLRDVQVNFVSALNFARSIGDDRLAQEISLLSLFVTASVSCAKARDYTAKATTREQLSITADSEATTLLMEIRRDMKMCKDKFETMVTIWPIDKKQAHGGKWGEIAHVLKVVGGAGRGGRSVGSA